ncbi:permease [Anaerosinus massiliensis]|uniref:permease n=1 Tax=Massilibacillus massiliensis TaxID=1806837 RepID=UPI000B260C9A|nr:permease [Massilibacillus massiliensis]
MMDWNNLINFKIILLSIIIEAFPFMLLSVIVSALIHNFVTEQAIHKILPKNKFFSVIIASLLGFIIPMCDCGIVPIVRRLLMKGVPLHTAIAFMLAAPITNPVAAAATLYAFRMNSDMVFFRLGIAIFIACFVGLMLDFCFKRTALKSPHPSQALCSCCSHTANEYGGQHSLFDKIIYTIRDASNEFFEMGKYLLCGAILGALAQIFLPRETLLSVGQSPILSIGVMMLFAFLISVCSAADAFIAASFSSSFLPGSLVAFMVLGPMVDVKNTLMLLHAFKLRFVLLLTFTVITLCACSAYIINQL